MNTEEIWKDAVGFEDLFLISNKGNVWSKRSNKILVQGILKSGYNVISSRISGRKGKCICVRVHRMVADAFIPNPKNKPCVNHKDGVKTNNNVDNLEWVTYSENTVHAFENNLITAANGINTGSAKLTDDVVRYIRENYKPKCKINGARALGKKYNVSHAIISDVVNFKTWKHVT